MLYYFQCICLWDELNKIKYICCCASCVNYTISTIPKQQGHIITYSVKNNRMYLLKFIKSCWFRWQVNDIPIVIWAKNWPLRTICGRLVACLFIWRYTINPMFVKHWCTCNTGTGYAVNCTYVMTKFCIKT